MSNRLLASAVSKAVGRAEIGEPDYPRSLFGFAEDGAILRIEPQYLFLDAARTTPITAPGDPVGGATDLSGNGNHFTQTDDAARPILRQDIFGKYYLEFGPGKYLNGPSSLLPAFDGGAVNVFADFFSDEPAVRQFVFDAQYGTDGNVNILAGFSASTVEGNVAGNRPTISGHPYARQVWRLQADSPSGSVAITINNAKSQQAEFAATDMGAAGRVRLGCSDGLNRHLNGGIYGMVIVAGNTLPETSSERLWKYMMRDLPRYDLFLVGGQSNAEGRGDSSLSPSVATGKAFEFDSTFEFLADPVGGASTGSAWPSFCDGYAESKSAIPAIAAGAEGAAGQTDSSGTTDPENVWQKGRATYDSAVTLAQDMESKAAEFGLKYKWKGVLWSQGERDAQQIDSSGGSYTAEEYKAGFNQMWTDLKSDISSSMYLFFARTGTKNSGDTAGFLAIRNAQDDLASSNDQVLMSFTGAVDFPAESKMSDDLHYTQDGYNEIGAALQGNTESP